MELRRFAPFILLVVVGCSGKSCGCGSPESSGTPTPPPQAVDCETPLKLCLATVRNTEGNLVIVNAVREACPKLEKKAFAVDSKDLAAIAMMGQDGAKCADELRACEDIRSRSLKLMQQAVKQLDGCNE